MPYRNANTSTLNQVHPPRPKRVRVDKQGNERCRMWLKEGTSTMLFTDSLTKNGCIGLINHINNYLLACGCKTIPQQKFLITR